MTASDPSSKNPMQELLDDRETPWSTGYRESHHSHRGHAKGHARPDRRFTATQAAEIRHPDAGIPERFSELLGHCPTRMAESSAYSDTLSSAAEHGCMDARSYAESAYSSAAVRLAFAGDACPSHRERAEWVIGIREMRHTRIGHGSDDCGSMLMLVSSMLIFGTIGIFRRYIPLSSGFWHSPGGCSAGSLWSSS